MPLELYADGPTPGGFVNATVEIKEAIIGGIPTQVFAAITFDDVHPYLANLLVPDERTGGPFAYVTVTQDSCIRGAGAFNFPSLNEDLKQKAAAGERWRIPIHRYDDCAADEDGGAPRAPAQRGRAVAPRPRQFAGNHDHRNSP